MLFTLSRRLMLASLLSVALPSSASEAASGQALFSTCSSCHGEQAQGNPALHAPTLAGQSQGYLSRQLSNFKSGLRGSHPADQNGASMRAMAATLVDEQAIDAVSRYLASLPAPPSTARLSGNPALGSRLYQAKCGACHGGKAEGNPALNSPRLSAQSDVYLQLQFQHFQQAIRGNEAGDRYGKQMRMMANTLNDTELLDVLAHISSLPQP